MFFFMSNHEKCGPMNTRTNEKRNNSYENLYLFLFKEKKTGFVV